MRHMVVAVNFQDLKDLLEGVHYILKALAAIPRQDKEIQITLKWGEDNKKWEVEVKSLNSLCSLSTFVPSGISGKDWVLIVFDELENHLLISGRFIPHSSVLGHDAELRQFKFTIEQT